jgi:cysteine desulfurase
MKKRDIAPIVFGGGQEGGLRSGTENVPAVAAFGEAIKIAEKSLRANYGKLIELRDYLMAELEEKLPEISITKPKKQAPHIVNITLPKIKSETMLHFLSSYGIYVSSGSACSSNSNHKSSALVAFGRSEEEADYSIRISLSHRNEKDDIDVLIDTLKIGLEKLSRVR